MLKGIQNIKEKTRTEPTISARNFPVNSSNSECPEQGLRSQKAAFKLRVSSGVRGTDCWLGTAMELALRGRTHATHAKTQAPPHAALPPRKAQRTCGGHITSQGSPPVPRGTPRGLPWRRLLPGTMPAKTVLLLSALWLFLLNSPCTLEKPVCILISWKI